MMTLSKAIAKMPRFMCPDLSRVDSFADLLFQVVHEIDLSEEAGGANADWTKRQIHTAKMYAANVHIWLLEAAAPDMLQALRGLGLACLADPLNPCWDNRPTDKPGLHWGSEPDAPIKACPFCIARAAIAKAEGK